MWCHPVSFAPKVPHEQLINKQQSNLCQYFFPGTLFIRWCQLLSEMLVSRPIGKSGHLPIDASNLTPFAILAEQRQIGQVQLEENWKTGTSCLSMVVHCRWQWGCPVYFRVKFCPMQQCVWLERILSSRVCCGEDGCDWGSSSLLFEADCLAHRMLSMMDLIWNCLHWTVNVCFDFQYA